MVFIAIPVTCKICDRLPFFIFILFIVTMKRASILEDEGKATQVEVLNMNTTDKENFNKNTAALQVYIGWVGICVCMKYSLK